MAKRKTVQAAATEKSERRLTWREEQFIYYYLENGRNATGAARAAGIPSPKLQGHRLLTYEHIQANIERILEKKRQALGFGRNDALEILVALATTTPDQLIEILQKPTNREKYVGLGLQKMGIQIVKSAEGGYEARTISVSEREKIVSSLWEKLGLDQEASKTDRVSFLERFAQLGAKLGRGDTGGEHAGGEGS